MFSNPSIGTNGSEIHVTDYDDNTAYISRDADLTQLTITINGRESIYLTNAEARQLASFLNMRLVNYDAMGSTPPKSVQTFPRPHGARSITRDVEVKNHVPTPADVAKFFQKG